ncbi:MAG: beta strand repeat-containing protein [Candidatus Acidiferrales bacterium]
MQNKSRRVSRTTNILLLLFGLAGLSGCALTASQSSLGFLKSNPNSLNFGKQTIGHVATLGVTLNNTGSTNVTIKMVTVTGKNFSVSGITTPFVLASNGSISFQVQYKPTAVGSDTGTITLVSNASDPSMSISTSGAGVSNAAPKLVVSPSPVDFNSVSVGSSSSMTVTLSNTGSATLNISQVSSTGSAFSISGIKTPLAIAAGSTSSLIAKFAPPSAGNFTGQISIVSDDPNSPTLTGLSGSGVPAAAPNLVVSPSPVAFNNVTVGSSSSQNVKLSNTGNATLNIQGASISGTGFSMSGLNTPVSINANSSVSFSVKFAPASTGNFSGKITITSNDPHSPFSLDLSGTGVAAPTPQLSISPSPVNFNSVTVGQTSSQTVTLKNTGNATLNIQAATLSGTGFSMSGLNTPLPINAGSNTTFTATFAPTSATNFSGTIVLTSNDPHSPTTLNLSGTGVAAPKPQLKVTPPNATFTNVVVNSTSSQTIQLQNSGSGTLTVTGAALTGTGYSMSGLNLPLNLNAGATQNFNLQFAPTTVGSFPGSITITSNDQNSPTTVGITGTSVAASFILNVSPSSLQFSNVGIGGSSNQTVTLTNQGNSNINISQIAVSGSGFTDSGITPPVTLTPNQNAKLTATFAPSVTGAVQGAITITSNAQGSPISVSLSGTGVQHQATLTWVASTSSNIVGYNVYRGTNSGGQYTKLTSSPVNALTYLDTAVVAGQTYFWVVTAVDSSGNESGFSNQASAQVPSP